MAIVLPKFPRRRSSLGALPSTQPAVSVSLCNEDGQYEASGTLVAKWRISRVPIDQLQGLEASVMWHTEGKGDEDLHVHHFHRLTEQQLRDTGLADEQSIHCRLPATPLSYHGKLITIRWSLRLRLFLVGGREILAERPFYMVARSHRDTRSIYGETRVLPARPMSSVVDWSNVVVPVGSLSRKPSVSGASRPDVTFTAS